MIRKLELTKLRQRSDRQFRADKGKVTPKANLGTSDVLSVSPLSGGF